MPLVTLSEVKALLQIPSGDVSKDTLIAMLIPLMQRKITDRLNNDFLDLNVQLRASTISFATSSPATILDSDAGFVDAYFAAGQDVHVQGTINNDGVYSVATVVAGTLTLASGETLTAEAARDAVTVTKVSWPPDLKVDAAHVIGYELAKQGKLIKSESLPGGASFDYMTEEEVWKPLNRFKRPYR